jgi:hypothetical protein
VERFLEMADRHIVEGDRIVSQQMDLIVRMKTRGLDTERSEAILLDFQQYQRMHFEHRDRVLRESNAPRCKVASNIEPLGGARKALITRENRG